MRLQGAPSLNYNMADWRPVLGYEGYYDVSDSCLFINKKTGNILRGTFDKKLRYLYIHLSKDGKAKTHRAHRLMLASFTGSDWPGMHARHLDGDTTNNILTNIAWGTVIENRDDCRRHGRIRGPRPGESHHNAKLSDA